MKVLTGKDIWMDIAMEAKANQIKLRRNIIHGEAKDSNNLLNRILTINRAHPEMVNVFLFWFVKIDLSRRLPHY
jgi:hypothetical protein